MPLISIITINYNNALGLKRTIESVIVQDIRNIEFIIIDGGSSDGSLDIIYQFQFKINYWISESDNGIYDAMNKGILQAKGEYLLFLNSSDVLVSSNVLSYVLPDLNADLVYGDLLIKSSKSSHVKKYQSLLDLPFFVRHSLPHPATFIKRSLMLKIGGYKLEYKIVADWVFFVEAFYIHHASYKHINNVISEFEIGGLSSRPENYLIILDEKRKFIHKALPKEQYILDSLNEEERNFLKSRRFYFFKLIRNKIILIYKRYLHAS